MRVGFADLGAHMVRNLWWTQTTVTPSSKNGAGTRNGFFPIGHKLDDLKVPRVTEIIWPDALWAVRGETTKTKLTKNRKRT